MSTAFDTIVARFSALNNTTLEQALSQENVVIESLNTMGGVNSGINTMATLRAVAGGGFSGAVNIGWRRLDLAKLFLGIPVVIRNPDALTTRDLVPIINAMYGTTLIPTDILSASLPPNANNANVVMTANPASLYLTGSFTLRFTKA